MAGDELTPMMRQYRRIKSELPAEAILLFRLGDFYEMFFDDAVIAAPLLGVALTQRNGLPMCGVPYHALDTYLSKLIRAGKRAAICDQMEDPATCKGIVRREVTRVVTPGTVTEEEILESSRNNFLAALSLDKKGGYGIAWLDLSTGAFFMEKTETLAALTDLLQRIGPSETLIPKEQQEALAPLCRPEITGAITEIDDWMAEYDCAYDALVRHFHVHSLEGFGCEGEKLLVAPAGALLQYVHDRLRHKIDHIKSIQRNAPDDFLVLDENTCHHLDLYPCKGKPMESTVLGVLDQTKTPMGARLLRQWIERPLRKIDAIRARHDSVEFLSKQRLALNSLRDKLTEVRDLERLIARINQDRGNARDLRALALSLAAVPDLARTATQLEDPLIHAEAGKLNALPDLVDLIFRAIEDTPPATMRDGGMIRSGYNAQLDEFRALAHDGHAWLAKFQATEQERTGIKTLKVRHNKIFGFYIEISKGNIAAVPPEYERRQTLVNAERFITPELKEYEQKIFGAQEKSIALELELVSEIRIKVTEETETVQQTAHAIATLDVLCSLADRALALGYVRPTMTEGDRLDIRDGRHPVIEQLPDAEQFVPNDTLLDCKTNQIMLITGPNMAGKSTYIRQVALIAVMAHIGSFVPAESAEISVLDRVFTRVGAGDDLARGRSTFMVEMQETANILNNATDKSLIVLDEIGRGTSTFDGISIAWAVAEFLHNTPRVKAKTLFATHYHELTDLSKTLPGVKNYTVQVRESGDTIVFLRRIARGTADKSYGIHVAQLAGMPEEVINRSKEILTGLEEGKEETGAPRFARPRKKKTEELPGQMHLF